MAVALALGPMCAPPPPPLSRGTGSPPPPWRYRGLTLWGPAVLYLLCGGRAMGSGPSTGGSVACSVCAGICQQWSREVWVYCFVQVVLRWCLCGERNHWGNAPFFSGLGAWGLSCGGFCRGTMSAFLFPVLLLCWGKGGFLGSCTARSEALPLIPPFFRMGAVAAVAFVRVLLARGLACTCCLRSVPCAYALGRSPALAACVQCLAQIC